MTQDEWFDKMSVAVQELHELSHKCESFDDRAREVAEIVGAQCDLLEYTTNTSSYGMRYLTPYDQNGLRAEVDEKLLWRLER